MLDQLIDLYCGQVPGGGCWPRCQLQEEEEGEEGEGRGGGGNTSTAAIAELQLG